MSATPTWSARPLSARIYRHFAPASGAGALCLYAMMEEESRWRRWAPAGNPVKVALRWQSGVPLPESVMIESRGMCLYGRLGRKLTTQFTAWTRPAGGEHLLARDQHWRRRAEGVLTRDSIRGVLANKDLHLLVRARCATSSHFTIMGLVSRFFRPTEQDKVRGRMIHLLHNMGGCEPASSGARCWKYGVAEVFAIRGEWQPLPPPFGVLFELRYGSSDGFGAYVLNAVPCLMPGECPLDVAMPVGRWFHGSPVDVMTWLEVQLAGFLPPRIALVQWWERAACTPLDYADTAELFRRAIVSRATIERVIGQLRPQSRRHGPTEAALVASLLAVAVHDPAAGNTNTLRGLATAILEHGLAQVLCEAPLFSAPSWRAPFLRPHAPSSAEKCNVEESGDRRRKRQPFTPTHIPTGSEVPP